MPGGIETTKDAKAILRMATRSLALWGGVPVPLVGKVRRR